MTGNKYIEHNDPHRYPKVMEPLENSMINIHVKGIKKMVVDVTKTLVKQKSSVH